MRPRRIPIALALALLAAATRGASPSAAAGPVERPPISSRQFT